MHRFYAPDISLDSLLPEEEARHCIRVLRLGAGSEIEVVDGSGTLYVCRIAEPDIRKCKLEILQCNEVPNHWGRNITLAVAPTKNADRMEWLAEKCVEMGIDRLVPVVCDNSERRVLKTERLRKIAVAAMKQSLKTGLPLIEELTPLKDFLNQCPRSPQRFVAYCDAALPRDKRRNLAKELAPDSDVVILIGPEGDFSPAEVEAAIGAGFVPVTLGESRLRTETAAMAAVATVHIARQLAE